MAPSPTSPVPPTPVSAKKPPAAEKARPVAAPVAQAASAAEAAGPALTLPPENDKTIWRATGRRKTSVARVSMKRGPGAFFVNGKEADVHFKGEIDRYALKAPLRATKTLGAFDVRVNVRGGGIAGQSGAILLGVARALKRAIPASDTILRAEGMLTRDPREKERRKYGRRKARAGFQWTKR